MKNIPVSIAKSTLPVATRTYESFDILGKTIGRYFDYKQNTKLIEHETEKVREQARVIIQNINAELTKSLDMNSKNFKKEMERLSTISTDLKSNAKGRSEILNNIKVLTKMLSDNRVDKEFKLMIPEMIKEAHQALKELNEQSIKTLSLMSGTKTKFIGGE